MILWMWWLQLWASWFAVIDGICQPEDPPPRPDNVIDLDRWRHEHPPGRVA